MHRLTFTTTRFATFFACCLLVAGSAVLATAADKKPASKTTPAVSFKEDILPTLQTRCVECHKPGGEGFTKSGLDLQSYEGLMKGTHDGPMVTPGNAMTSNLLVLVEGKAGIRMPHNRRSLNRCELQALRDWVNQGAHDN